MPFNEYDDIIARASADYDVPADWIKAVIGTESSFNPNTVREEPRINDRSIGLMQLLTRTAHSLGYSGTDEGLFDPETNIRLGTQLLAELRARYGMVFERVYSAYNSGDPNAWEWSATVKRNVRRAVDWLSRVTEGPTASTLVFPLAGAGLLALIGFYLWHH